MFSLMIVVLEVLFMSWMTQSQVDSYSANKHGAYRSFANLLNYSGSQIKVQLILTQNSVLLYVHFTAGLTSRAPVANGRTIINGRS